MQNNYSTTTLINVINTVPIGILVVDENQEILIYNDKFVKLWDIPANILQGSQINKIFEVMQTKTNTPLQLLSSFSQADQIIYEIKLNSNVYLEQYTAVIETIQQDNKTKAFNIVYSFYDISAKKKLANRLEQQIIFDKVTELPNKIILLDRLQQHIAYAEHNNSYVALMCFGLYEIKHIKKHFGASVFEQLLKMVGQRLKTHVREQDTVARVSEDEFVVVIASKIFNLETFYKIINRLFQQVLQPYNLHEHIINININMGISFYPQDGIGPEVLINNANEAMYTARQQSSNTFKMYNEKNNVHNFLFNFLSEDPNI